jgi:hypothetical protein
VLANRVRAKKTEPAMTHLVMPFRQNRATSVAFLVGDWRASGGGILNSLDKTAVIRETARIL